jgi:proton-translocating NAD(P)+ transhydrogenase subunit alpha
MASTSIDTMIIGVLREPSFETRVSVLPEMTAAIIKKGVLVKVESGAGIRAFAADADYALAGAEILPRNEVIANAEVILCLHQPEADELILFRSKIIIGVFQPLYHATAAAHWATLNITSFSLDMLPRTTRAQSMDVLSSQANIAGYKAVLTAANIYSRYFPMLMTAAGSIAPAKVLILGAGVAGLQAIATAKRLGSVVEVFDTRPAVKEEVMSLGGKFIEVEGAADASKAGGYAVEQTPEFMQRQKDKIAESIAKADIVISTAQIPGRRAPVLITAEMISHMKKGSVIIDLAAATGGNSELTMNNETIIHNGITIVGNSALPATMPSDASKLYGKNVFNFLQLIITGIGELNLNFADDLVTGCCITHNGAVMHERVKLLLTAAG